MNTKLHSTALALILVSAASACSKAGTDGPAPGPTTETTTETAVASVQLAPGDFMPKRLASLRPNLGQLPREKLSSVAAASPKGIIAYHTAPKPDVSKATQIAVVPGAKASSAAVAIDAAEGATISMIPMDTASYDNVLKDLAVYEPTGRMRIDLRANMEETFTPLEHKPMMTVNLEAKMVPGLYLVKVGDVAAKNGATIWAMQPNSTITMELLPSTTLLLGGDTGKVQIKLVDEGAPVLDAALEGTLVGAGLVESPITVRDVGGGVYEALVSDALGPDAKPGTYDIKVRAKGTSNGKKFDRFGTTAMTYVAATGRILSVSAPRTVLDATGLIEAFELDARIEASVEDRFELDGILAMQMPDGTDRPLETSQTAETLSAGIHTVTLRFDAGYLGLAKLEGAISLRGLSLYSQGWNQPLQRHTRGLEIRLPAIKLARLAPLKQMAPGIDEMMKNGDFVLEQTF